MYEIIGIEHRQYTNKAGRQVSGYNLYAAWEQKNVNGRACMREWVSDDVMETSGVTIGDKADILYNRYGRVEAIKPVG